MGGPYPASPSGKSWEEASGKTGSGEKFYRKVISGAHFAAQPYFVTPVIHYCMGGLEIDEQFWVRIPSQSAQVAGGARDNRLGGNSLLDYVVSGRVEGVACAKYDRAKALAGGRKVEGSKSDQAIVVNTVLKNGGSVVLRQQAESTERERIVRKIQQGGAKKPELAKLRKLSSFQCAKRCKSRTLQSAAKGELREVTLLYSR